MSISDFNASVGEYARGKSWYWYLPLWLIGFYAFIELLQFDMVKGEMPFILLIPYSFNFFMHEMAHIVTAFLPPILTASAGSGSELLLGTGLVIMGFWQRSYFACLFCFLWFDLACQSAGQYMADAIPQLIPLVSLGGAISGQDPIHDWHFVFGQMGLLGASAFIGNSIRVIGFLGGFIGVAFAAWLIYKMIQAPSWVPNNDETLLAAAHPIDTPHPKRTQDDGFTSVPVSDPTLSHDPNHKQIT